MKKFITLIIAFMAVVLPLLSHASEGQSTPVPVILDTLPLKDLEYISNRYILEVANSKDLTENQQDNVISAVFTMASSAEYWKVFDQNTK